MSAQVKRLRISAQLEQVEDACEFVAEVARDIGMTDEAVYHCYLAVEEICTNIIEHGYGYRGENKVIDIECSAKPYGLEITVIDDAEQFNPLKLNEPDPSAPLVERKTGGWGVFFVRKYMDRIDYRYVHNRNQLIMEKYYN
jgi:anti-sigma regulatory factor (Ser/Thr protein kinase)